MIRVLVLLTDSGSDSVAARKLLRQAGIPFSEVSTDTPGREGRPAPQLYTTEGTLPDLGVIRAWVNRVTPVSESVRRASGDRSARSRPASSRRVRRG
jgi:hypothetical protein